jgi:hypothetical protein
LIHLDNFPDPDELIAYIIENLEAGLEGFREVLEKLKTNEYKLRLTYKTYKKKCQEVDIIISGKVIDLNT